MPLIAYEGIDGSGKLTQLYKLMDGIEKAQPNHPNVAWSSEPNDRSSPLGKFIRSILEKEQPITDEFKSQRLFVLDRAQDIFCFIRPLVDRGRFYLMERYAYSTIAYGMLSGYPLSISSNSTMTWSVPTCYGHNSRSSWTSRLAWLFSGLLRELRCLK